jgi:hypothetical protein
MQLYSEEQIVRLFYDMGGQLPSRLKPDVRTLANSLYYFEKMGKQKGQKITKVTKGFASFALFASFASLDLD